jgi:NAD(P)-dependent dehydrogenase (short-subunit alcohol dehydrogenase family)
MSNKTALVTGGAGGLGRAAALELAARGIDVAIADRRLDEAEETAKECRANGVKATAFEFDQMKPESVQTCIRDISNLYGAIDLLFANAGTGRFRSFLEMTPEEWRFTVDVNLNGTFYVCSAAAKEMIRAGRSGAMVLTSSSGAEAIVDQLSAYCCAKAGVLWLTKHIASELGPYRIRANAILPGVVETRLTSPMLGEEKWRTMLKRDTPLGRWGQAAEIGKVVAFLLSDDASYINGEAIMVDGGATLHGSPRWYSLDYNRGNHQDWK